MSTKIYGLRRYMMFCFGLCFVANQKRTATKIPIPIYVNRRAFWFLVRSELDINGMWSWTDDGLRVPPPSKKLLRRGERTGTLPVDPGLLGRPARHWSISQCIYMATTTTSQDSLLWLASMVPTRMGVRLRISFASHLGRRPRKQRTRQSNRMEH